jgi:transcriptional regulator with XRE-family HTH domain
MIQWEDLREPWERLRWARARAGFERAKDAADSLGMNPVTYRSYERRPDQAGARMFDHQAAARLGKKFKCSWNWLLTGEGSPDDAMSPTMRVAEQMAERIDQIEEGPQREAAVQLILSVLENYSKKAG